MAKKLKTDSVIAVTVPEVELSGMVTVIAANNAEFMNPGKEYEVSAELAKTLIKKGSVTLKK